MSCAGLSSSNTRKILVEKHCYIYEDISALSDKDGWMEDIFRVNYYCYSVKIVTIKGDECLVLFQTEICYCIGVMVQPIRAPLSSSRPSNRGQKIYEIK